MNNKEIKQFLHSNSALFHFTKYHTATEYILRDMQLRLSLRKNMNDPFEKNTSPNLPYNSSDNDEIEKRNDSIIKELDIDSETVFNNAKQISFCIKNDNHASIDKYGYARIRMWDQYADNYKGVCIIIDKEKIPNKEEFLIREIEYKSIDFFREYNSVDANDLIDKKKFDEYKQQNVYNRLFYKHIDYKEENEYRIVSLTKNKNEEFIDVKNSIVAIMIITEYLLTSQVKYLYELSEKKNIPLLYLSIKDDFHFNIAQDFIFPKTKNDERFFSIKRKNDNEKLMTFKKVRTIPDSDFFSFDIPVPVQTKTNT